MTPHTPLLSVLVFENRKFLKNSCALDESNLNQQEPNCAKEGLYATFCDGVLSPSKAPSSSRYTIRSEQVPYSLRKKYSERKGKSS